jgi:hypothetical protein
MKRFAGRPWMAAAFTSFVISAVSLFGIPPLWPLAVSLGLAFMTLEMTRPGPPPPDDTAG